MKKTQLIMGTPVTIELVDLKDESVFTEMFDYFSYVDQKFSTYKDDSEISRINRGELLEQDYSDDMKEVLRLCREMKQKTAGYFDIRTPQKLLDPSGLVKGWAIFNASKIADKAGITNYFVSAGDDIQLRGHNKEGKPWSVGIRHPFKLDQIVKVLYLTSGGVATSGTYLRGKHIYNPLTQQPADDLVSLTVIGPNVYEADIYATACFAMGKDGLSFLEKLDKFEGYSINKEGIATFTSGLERLTAI